MAGARPGSWLGNTTVAKLPVTRMATMNQEGSIRTVKPKTLNSSMGLPKGLPNKAPRLPEALYSRAHPASGPPVPDPHPTLSRPLPFPLTGRGKEEVSLLSPSSPGEAGREGTGEEGRGGEGYPRLAASSAGHTASRRRSRSFTTARRNPFAPPSSRRALR